jgi:pyruvate kinase
VITFAAMRRAKIVCTLGPASSTPERVGELIEAGMDVARLNLSHGDHESHSKLLQTIRREAEQRQRAVAILLDLQGPKIRVGKFENGSVELSPGNEFTITTDTSVLGTARRVSTSYTGLPHDVRPGDQILLDDGYLSLAVTEIAGPRGQDRGRHRRRAQEQQGHEPAQRRGLGAGAHREGPGRHRLRPAHGGRLHRPVVRQAPEDVVEAKRLATADGVKIPIIAKIEKPQAIDHLDEIVEVADGIMVARGDLGVEMGPEKVPLIQKRIIELTNSRGKVVITATQMLESMINNSRPTRAEASDVANAVLDGTDALMLSGETAAGSHPVESVLTMSRIISEIEQSSYYRTRLEPVELEMQISANAIAHAAVIAARQMGTKTIAVVTESGGAARLMSEYRPEARIFALTTDEVTYRRLALYWGVTPILIGQAVTTDEMLDRVEKVLLECHHAVSGEYVTITMAVPVGSGETTNMLKIHRMP